MLPRASLGNGSHRPFVDPRADTKTPNVPSGSHRLLEEEQGAAQDAQDVPLDRPGGPRIDRVPSGTQERAEALGIDEVTLGEAGMAQAREWGKIGGEKARRLMEERRKAVDVLGPENMEWMELSKEWSDATTEERLLGLREWSRWRGAGPRLGDLLAKLTKGGLKALTDEDLAECHLIQFRMAGGRPGSMSNALGALTKLRENGWRHRHDVVKARVKGLIMKLRRAEIALRAERRKYEEELAGEKRRVENATRISVTAAIRREEELRQRVKKGVGEMFENGGEGMAAQRGAPSGSPGPTCP